MSFTETRYSVPVVHDEIEYEYIESLHAITKKLSDEEASHVLYMQTRWAYWNGFAKGMAEGLALLKPTPPAKDEP